MEAKRKEIRNNGNKNGQIYKERYRKREKYSSIREEIWKRKKEGKKRTKVERKYIRIKDERTQGERNGEE
jgi:hypothetical protein